MEAHHNHLGQLDEEVGQISSSMATISSNCLSNTERVLESLESHNSIHPPDNKSLLAVARIYEQVLSSINKIIKLFEIGCGGEDGKRS